MICSKPYDLRLVHVRFEFIRPDKNIPGADMAMSKARKIVEYYSKSTQQTAKLVEFQSNSSLPIYSENGYCPKKLIQDVITRWWSTYRMLKRLRLCKPALICLHAAGTSKCEMLNDEQWVILEQIEITLKKMASWQRILEGDKYPTGSLVVSAIFSIREHYASVIECPDTKAPVKSLASILLTDFDTRYHPPPDDIGKVRFTCEPETGRGNRYTGVHPYFFIAAFLDLRTRKALKKMMVTEQYEELRALILEIMVGVAKKKEMYLKAGRGKKNDNDGDTPDAHPPGKAQSQLDFAFEGLYDDGDSLSESDDDDTIDEDNIRIGCEHQLKAYELLPVMKIKDSAGKYNDPLKVWKENEAQYPELSQLAAEFLTIPAMSAPSERVWSRASRVITAKRSCLSPDVTERMIFFQENVQLICEHWKELRPNMTLSESYLPRPVKDVDEDGNLIDIGQHDDD